MNPYPQLAADLGAPLHGGESYLPDVPILKLFKKPYYIEGDWRGRRLKIHNFTRGAGKHRSTHHAIELGLLRPVTMSFKLGQEHFFTKIGKALGMQDIQTGDAEFDAKFIVKASDEAFIHSAFLPEIRQQFLSIARQCRFGFVELKYHLLRYEQHAYLNGDQGRQSAVALSLALADLAAAIEVYAEA